MKRRKRIVMSVICGLLVAAVALGGTLAYLTDSESITNTFTVGTGYEGNDAFTLDETQIVEGQLPTEPTDTRTGEDQEYPGLLPGTQFAKDPTFHLGTNGNGTHVIESYIVAKLTNFDKAYDEGYRFFKNDGKTEGLNSNWVKVGDIENEFEEQSQYDGYYIFTKNGETGNMDLVYTGDNEDQFDVAILDEDEDTDALFTYVQLKDMGNDEFKGVDSTLNVNISGVAVQAPYTSPRDAVQAAIEKLSGSTTPTPAPTTTP